MQFCSGHGKMPENCSELDARQICTQTKVGSTSAKSNVWIRIPSHIELIGVDERFFVPVGRFVEDYDVVAFFDGAISELDIACGRAPKLDYRTRPTEDLLHG